MSQYVTIPERFRGPPNSANGGYACGVVAGLLEGLVEVTLRRPPPLDLPMAVSYPADGHVEIHDDHGLVAEGRTGGSEPVPPPPVTWEQSVEAATRYRGFDPGATFASCFVCSPEREDGLRIFPGPVQGVVVAPWTPDRALAGSGGGIPPAIVWAALDCPTFFAATESGQLALLGRMAARVSGVVRAGEPHVVVAQRSGADGRKRFGSSAVYTVDGELLAAASATWITIEYP